MADPHPDKLEEHLEALAKGEGAPAKSEGAELPPVPAKGRSESPRDEQTAGEGPQEIFTAEFDEDQAAVPSPSKSLAGAAMARGPRRGRAVGRRGQRKGQDSTLREVAAPVLITVGLLMLLPAVWATLVLLGNTTLPNADRPDAPRFAKLMLVCWPVGLVLVSTGLRLLTAIWRNRRGGSPRLARRR